MKKLLLILFCFPLLVFSQNWQAFTDSIPTLSSPRSSDLNGDGVMDIVIGGGTDSVFSNNGIMAYNGVDGSLLWKRPSRNEVFGSAIFQDITADGIDDVIIVGRSAQLLAIDGVNGTLVWDYFPYGTNPADSGLYNFYNPQFIHDVDGDTYPDILVSNGGDHAAPPWQSNRPAGHLMVVSALTGNLIVKAVVPDSSETYCSPIVADIQNTGKKWILYGTGGENYGGNFYAVVLDDLLLGDLTSSITLASDPNKGFIAPAAIHKTNSGAYDIVIQSFDGLVTKIAGQTFSPIWTYQMPGTESSAEPVIGNFTGDLTPDVLLVLFKGVVPSYNDYYQVMLDGNDGSVQFLDSLGAINFASANAVDLNNDGRDEGIYSVTYLDSGYFINRVESIDFTTNTINTLDQTRTGVNIGSTPLITDLDNNGLLDLVYSVKEDSLNPMGWNGINVYRHELSSIIPNSGIAWGSYLGTNMDGAYNSELTPCWPGTIISSVNRFFPSCNGASDGSISLSLVGGASPYTYIWSNQSTDSSIQNLAAGSYWVQVVDSTGCYESITITLPDPFAIMFGEIIPPTCIGDSNGTATVNSSGCPCMFSGCTFLWDNGVTIKTNSSLPAGWSSVAITHANGCVIVDSVFLEMDSNIDSILVTSCDSYTWDSIVYTMSGVYTNTYTDTSGCDSIVILDLTISDSNSSTSLADSCDSYTWDDVVYTTSGIYSNTFTNVNGCDSVHTLDLTINSSYSYTFDVNECDYYIWYGTTYTNTGFYDTLFTTINGCDSLITLDLTIPVSDTTIISVTVCDSYTWLGTTYTTSGVYDSLYEATWSNFPCDSLVILDLTINNNTGSSSITSCDSYTWDSVVYTMSGVYSNIYTNMAGCDSIHTLNLTINNSDSIRSVIISCDTYTWNGITYDSTGIYSTLFTNVDGCDSLHTLDLTIATTNVVILLQFGGDLIANILSGDPPFIYQWSTGENIDQITPASNGEYWVIVTDSNGCVSDTAFYNVTWVPSSIRDLNLEKLIVYPNPSQDVFNLEFNSLVNQDLRVRVINILGEEIVKEDLEQFIGKYTKKIDLTTNAKGVYSVEIVTDSGIINKTLLLQ
ncbi:MAG: T9SS type A sorting domain-containing protein [Flavobacteriales bacterium]|nr:T9SS type A sorting domain-containing protein [Flavobacteriales bacterium]